MKGVRHLRKSAYRNFTSDEGSRDCCLGELTNMIDWATGCPEWNFGVWSLMRNLAECWILLGIFIFKTET